MGSIRVVLHLSNTTPNTGMDLTFEMTLVFDLSLWLMMSCQGFLVPTTPGSELGGGIWWSFSEEEGCGVDSSRAADEMTYTRDTVEISYPVEYTRYPVEYTEISSGIYGDIQWNIQRYTVEYTSYPVEYTELYNGIYRVIQWNIQVIQWNIQSYTMEYTQISSRIYRDIQWNILPVYQRAIQDVIMTSSMSILCLRV